jgi:hypothetical protein
MRICHNYKVHELLLEKIRLKEEKNREKMSPLLSSPSTFLGESFASENKLVAYVENTE